MSDLKTHIQYGGSFVPYPGIDDPDFHDRIFWKKEFLKTLYQTDFQYSTTEEMCRRGEFRMQNHQEFIRNFISPETPYNGALLFHGTGVGKTCAAMGATEGLRDYVHKNGKKIYVLSSRNIRPNFYKELYDADRAKVEEDIHAIPGSYQCAGDRYYVDYHKSEIKKRAAEALIREYYVFKGPDEFTNFVDVELGAVLPKHMTKPKMTMEDGSNIDIGDYFSNSVIIVDEAHNIAGENKSKSSAENEPNDELEPELEPEMEPEADEPPKKRKKKVKVKGDKTPRNISNRSLFKVLLDSIVPACRAKGGNLKILLLTATPMKDDVREVGNLLELLNKNDGRHMEDGWKNRIFPRGIMNYTDLSEAFGPDQEAELMRYARGYISYVKGNNPVTFPKAILPPADQLYEPGKRFSPDMVNPIFSYGNRDGENVDVQDKYNITSPPNFRFNLVKCEMDWYQFACYQALVAGNVPGSSLTSDTHPRMISNMAYPVVIDGSNPITPFTVVDNPNLLKSEKDGGILTSKGAGNQRPLTVYGTKGFDYTFRSKQKIVPGTSDHVSPKKYISYDIYAPIWEHCGFFMMIDENPGSGVHETSKDYTLSLFSKKLDLFVRNVNNSPGIAYAYSEFVETGAIITALALETNGYVRYHPNLKQYIQKDTGLPRPSLRTELPECFLYDLNDKQQKQLPTNHYRCSVCGELYKNCMGDRDTGRAGPHTFNLATYVVVTGSHGGIKEIAEAVTNNIRGEKIKVVIGTQVTGTGVDFKWIRQIHILDPWHNNTRIYQAIGRGLRHCSHADLPVSDRNVQVYRYASTTNVNPIIDADNFNVYDMEQLMQPVVIQDVGEMSFTYKDLLTETVDEHIYRRVIRKDLIIKVVERALKRIAIDCEFNKNRNMFPADKGGDDDYTRECDYMECAYTCEGFKDPIKYVRRIRLYTGGNFSYVDGDNMEHNIGTGTDVGLSELVGDGDQTNAEFWQQFQRNHRMIEDDGYKELLVDIPIPGPEGGMDNSTYNIHFSAPQIDKAIKLISRLFQKTYALKLDKIVHLVKKLNSQLEEKFVYSALDRIVGNPPYVKPLTLIDKHGRRGKIIVHNKIYIYQPLELEDHRIPMSYRSKPLTIKSRYYNMDKLTSKVVKKAVQRAAHVDPNEIQRLNDYINNLNFESVATVVELHLKLYSVLIGELAELLEKMVIESAVEPESSNVQYLVEYCLQSGMAFFIPYDSTDSNTRINELLKECSDPRGNRSLLHIMKSTKQAGTNVMVYTKGAWKKPNIDNLPGGHQFLSYNNDGEEVPDLRYPSSDMAVALAEPRKLLTELNDNSTTYLDKYGVYGMMSKPIFRTTQPIFRNKTIRTILLSAVEGYNLEYPNHTALNMCKFKVFDQNKREKTITKTQGISKRGEIKGKVCITSNEHDVYELLGYLSDVIQNKENYAIITSATPGLPVDKLMKSLNIYGKMIDGVFVPSKSNKQPACEYLKTLLIVANYFNLNNVRWFLNPIDTAIYRPVKN